MGLLVLIGVTVALSPTPLSAQDRAEETLESLLHYYDPPLLRQAEEQGLYDRNRYPVLREVNPYYIRGDFNGDGGMDVAFWVTERESGLRGVAILHSTLDTLYLFGAGRNNPFGGAGKAELVVDVWHPLPAGQVATHPHNDVPEIGVEVGVPFTFQREILEFVYLEKAAFVFYWAEGRYWVIWTVD